MLKKNDINALMQHWALSGINHEYIDKAENDVKEILAQKTLGDILPIEAQSIDYDNLLRMGNIYETIAIEAMDQFITATEKKDQFIAAAWKAYDFYSVCDLDITTQESRIFDILHISSLAYCGERWNDLRGFYADKSVLPIHIGSDVFWDKVVLETLYNCWVKLFNKTNWEDLNAIILDIVNLRKLQKQKEKELFINTSANKDDAIKLVSLYHLARATELLAEYTTQGTPTAIRAQLDKHFEAAIEAAQLSGDADLEILSRWLYCAALQMIEASIWWIARTINSRTTDFVKYITKNSGLFELLPPQKTAIREQGLLDAAKISIAIEMPTSGGKTLLAEFKILQALNQFSADNGWVAYVAPTKALAAQITRKFRKDFQESIKVEQLTAALSIDSFEEELLDAQEKKFDVLIATPEKLNMVIKNNKVKRPLALVVMDEAHNIEDEERGLRIELLLATIKNECNNCNFLLLMPYVENVGDIAKWLASDADSFQSISISGSPWKPSEKMIGLLKREKTEGRGNWQVNFVPVVTTRDTLTIDPMIVAEDKPIPEKTFSQVALSDIAEVAAKKLQEYGTCIVVTGKVAETWKVARNLQKVLPIYMEEDADIILVQNYLRDELGENFELINMLSRGIGVHNSGLSDDIRTLMEWLAEEGKLRILCATTTIAQGINFPINSVVLQTINHSSAKGSKPMSSREFWNLAGRTGRIGQGRIGVVGLACKDEEQSVHYQRYLSEATGELVSRISKLLENVDILSNNFSLDILRNDEQWADFRCFIAHLCNQKDSIDAALADTEQLLRSTLGYRYLRNTKNGEIKARLLLETTKQYIRRLKNDNMGAVRLADETGFTPEGISSVLYGIKRLNLSVADFQSKSLFGREGKLSSLYGVMLQVQQLKGLKEIAGTGFSHVNLANITSAWVNGESIQDIAEKFFNEKDMTINLSQAYRTINKQIANLGTWGLSALTKLGVDYGGLSPKQIEEINALPAMIYHGVNTREAVLMRMNFIPRGIAEKVGILYKNSHPDDYSIESAHSFIRKMDDDQWNSVVPTNSSLKGKGYKYIWELISGEKIR